MKKFSLLPANELISSLNCMFFWHPTFFLKFSLSFSFIILSAHSQTQLHCCSYSQTSCTICCWYYLVSCLTFLFPHSSRFLSKLQLPTFISHSEYIHYVKSIHCLKTLHSDMSLRTRFFQSNFSCLLHQRIEVTL